MAIKWDEKDVIKAFSEAMQPPQSQSQDGKGRVLIEQMKQMARKGQMPKPETMMETR